jgi:hypothetical protein
VSFDGGEPLVLLKWDSKACSSHYHPIRENEKVHLPLPNPQGATTMRVEFGLTESGNNWWWAVDAVEITGRRTLEGGKQGVPAPVARGNDIPRSTPPPPFPLLWFILFLVSSFVFLRNLRRVVRLLLLRRSLHAPCYMHVITACIAACCTDAAA